MKWGGLTAVASLVAITLLDGCKGRLTLTSAYRDASGHRLSFFDDSLFIGAVGDPSQAFYRMTSTSHGHYRIRPDSSIILYSDTDRVDSFCAAQGRDVTVLKGYRLTRMRDGLEPDRPYRGDPTNDPFLLEMWSYGPDRSERLDLERAAWNLKHCGHPYRRCRKRTWLRLGVAKVPLR